MSDEINIKLKTTLEADEGKSTAQIESQLPSIASKIKGTIKVKVEADTKTAGDDLSSSIQKVITSQKKWKATVPVEIGIKTDSDYLRRKLEQDFKKFTAQSKDLKIDTSAYQKAFDIGAFKDAHQELIILQKMLNAISAADVSKMPSLSITNFSKNVEKAVSTMDTLQSRVNAVKVGDTSALTGQISKIRAELSELAKLETGSATDADIGRFNALKLGIDQVVNSLSQLKAQERNFKIDVGAEKLQTDIERAKQALLNMKVDSSAMFKDVTLTASWDKLWSTINGGAIKSQAELTAFRAQFNLLNSQVTGAGLNMKTFWGRTLDNFKKFVNWFAIGGFTASAVRSVKDVITTVKDLNKAFVDLRIATGGSQKETAQLLSSYSSLAKNLGATTSEVASAADDWLRQGKTIAETESLIESSMILSKVGKIDAAASTEYLTSATKGYRLEVEEALGVVDKLTAVDKVSATSAGGLAQGMSEVANGANLAGVSMEKLLGYLAVIGETTQQEMSAVGNSLSTVFARMGNIKLSRLGDFENNGEDLSNVETVLRGLDIKLRDSNQEFRNFGDVLDETAANWKNYSSVSKRAIASAFAGRNHMENFLVLMENYNTATEYSAVAADSAGSAMEKYGMYLDGVEAKQNKATAAAEALSMSILNSDVVGGFYDAKAGFLGFLTQIIEKLRIIPTIAGAAAAALSFKNKGRIMPTNTQLLYCVLAQ